MTDEARGMSDKDVGDCWRCCPLLPPPGEEVARALIRKLVEEAEAVYWAKYGCITGIHQDALIKRFGLPRDFWEAKP
jgi:hypothetical protein